MKYFNNNNLIKLTLVYWLLLVLVEVFFHPFTTRYIAERDGKLFNEVTTEWALIFNVAIFVPLVLIAIIKILQWKK